ncbi:MAG TPA: enolase C-terminal domain-like protein [Drouetiella sp.]|jgi:L-Ala-D/L-Glu epimerase
MKIKSIDSFLITLPFRFSFKHSLASRNHSENLIVRIALQDGNNTFVGFGEGIPRDYVTGESPAGALAVVGSEYAPALLGRQFDRPEQAVAILQEVWSELKLSSRPQGASFCAVELALLDAAAKSAGKTVPQMLVGREASIPEAITYGAVVPFGGRKALSAVLWFYKAYGFKTVKIKVGKDLQSDLHRLAIARSVLGPDVHLRVDANCAWTFDEAVHAAEQMRAYGVNSYEQPLPADRFDELAALTKIFPEQILADESLCTVDDARHLAEKKVCSAFNIRVSKVGGILAARQIAAIARASGIACHMGAQVGESGILSAAGRAFASIEPPFENCEGSNNFFLLKQDITAENLNVGLGGRGKVLKSPGLGVNVKNERLQKFISSETLSNLQPPLVAERTV